MVMSRLKTLVSAIAGGVCLSTFTGVAAAAWGLNLQNPATPIAREILSLHNLILLVCLGIFVVVFSVMFYSIYAHRKSRGHTAAQFSHSNTVEVVWTIIPFLILVGMAIPSTKTLIKMEDTSEADLTVKITGYQWKWGYEYLDNGISYYSNLATPREQILNEDAKGDHYLLEVDRPLVLPTNRKVRFLVTADDVIHSWWIPAFGVKKDAIPGFINETWASIEQPGVYRGQCAELCGKDHGFMPIVVEAKSPEEFDAWVAAQKQQAAAESALAQQPWSRDALMTKGREVYNTCAACHGSEGKGVPNVFPAIAGSPVANGPLPEHLDVVLNGRSGTAMQAFKTHLSDVEIAAVVTYQRNAFGNSGGDLVQPAQVTALR